MTTVSEVDKILFGINEMKNDGCTPTDIIIPQSVADSITEGADTLTHVAGIRVHIGGEDDEITIIDINAICEQLDSMMRARVGAEGII